MSTLERAIAIAAEAHAGQTDRAGRPYVLHPLRVMLGVHPGAGQIVAALHDVVEDSAWTLDDLRAEGFAEPVVRAVAALTRGDDEDYFDYVRRAGSDATARAVKVADLNDNLDTSRLPRIGERDEERIARYREALRILGVEEEDA